MEQKEVKVTSHPIRERQPKYPYVINSGYCSPDQNAQYVKRLRPSPYTHRYIEMTDLILLRQTLSSFLVVDSYNGRVDLCITAIGLAITEK